jgi:hypothetical protein
MADTTTTNYAFTKPEPGGSNETWDTKLNANWDALDTQLATLAPADTVAALTPAATVDIDLASTTIFTLTPDQNTTITLSNVTAVDSFTLTLTGASTYTITYPAAVKWAAGTAPDAPAAAEVDVLTFFTTDSGTTWYAFQAGDAMA